MLYSLADLATEANNLANVQAHLFVWSILFIHFQQIYDTVCLLLAQSYSARDVLQIFKCVTGHILTYRLGTQMGAQ